MQKVHCDACRAPYEVDPRRIPPSGMNMRCPACGASFHVQPDGSDDLLADLPAPAGGGELDFDLPALKSGGAPSGAFDADLPAPRGGGGDADLPALKGGMGGADLPALKGGMGGADLPAPKARGSELADLPAPKAPSPAGVTDLPAPKAPAPVADLPAPKASASTAFGTSDLPPPAAPEASFEDVGLSAPKGGMANDTLGGLDLPAPKAPAPALDDIADLPAPKAPTPAGPGKLAPDFPSSPNADLPALKPSAPGAPDGGVDLPALKAGGLPNPSEPADLPAVKPAPGKLAPDFPQHDGGADLPALKEAPSSIPPRRNFGRPNEAPAAASAPGGKLPKDSLALDPGPVGDQQLPTADPFGSDDADLPALKGSGADLPALKDDGVDLPAAKGGADLPAAKVPGGSPTRRKQPPSATKLGVGVSMADLPTPGRGDTMTTGKPPARPDAADPTIPQPTDPSLASRMSTQAKPSMEMTGVDLPAPKVAQKKPGPMGTAMGIGSSLPRDSLDLPGGALGPVSDAPLATPFDDSASRPPADTAMGLDAPTHQTQPMAREGAAPADTLPKDSLDLPAPADLPGVKGAVPPRGTAMGIGATAPAAPSVTPKDSLDLPAPADLPTPSRTGAPQGTAMGIGGSLPKDSLDLPSPADLPAPLITNVGDAPAARAPQGTAMGIGTPDTSGGTLPKDSLDLPSPDALDTSDLDLGTAGTDLGFGGGLPTDSLDLPSPGALGGPGAETDLGIGTGSLDAAGPLPKPSGPAPKPGGGFDLGASLPKDSLDLPSPGALTGGGASLDDSLGDDALELPQPGTKPGTGALGGEDFIPRSSLGAGTVDLSAAELADLKIESRPPGPGGELPLPEVSGANPLPTGALDTTGADPFGDLGPPSAIPQPVRAPSSPAGSDDPFADDGGTFGDDAGTFGDDPFGGMDAEPAAGPAGEEAGRDHFGELDLGFGEDELEGGDIPEMESVSQPPAESPTTSVEDELLGGDDEAPVQSTRRKKQRDLKPGRKIPAWTVLAVIVVLFAGLGVTLGLATPYGWFGVYLVEQLLPAAGDPVKVKAAIEQAEAKAQSDTYTSVRAALAVLSEARNEAGLNRALLSRSLLHEALYQLRFGQDTGSAQRSSAILARILDRGSDVPGLALARAADSARKGDFAEANRYLEQVTAADDAYRGLVDGEIALKQKQWSVATASFTRSLGRGGHTRAQWGLARAHLGAGDMPKAEKAVLATLELSPRHTDALVSAATFAKREGRLDEAHEYTRKATGRVVINGQRAKPSRATRSEGWSLEGEIEEQREHTGEAHRAFEQALKAEPLSIRALLGSGRTLLRMARPRDALARFDSALSAKPSEKPGPGGGIEIIDATVGAARSLLSLERARDAQTRLAALQGKFGEHPDLNLWLGRTNEALGETEAAEGHYRVVMDKAPDRFDGYLALSQLLFSLKRNTEAAKVLEDAAGRVDDGPEVRRMLGHSELTRNRLDQAIQQFNAALTLDEADGGAWFGLAIAHRQKGEIDKASAALDRLEAVDPTFPGLSMERGLLHEARADYEAAVEAYRSALEQRPHDLDLRLRLGAALVTAGKVDEADAILHKVLKERPTSAEAEHFVGRVLFARQETDQALAHFERAVNLDITKAEYHLYVAWASLEQGDLTRALEAVGTAIERDPSLGDAHWIRGRIMLRTGQVRDALDDLATALRLKPGRHEARANMGEAYDQLRELKQAVRAYETAVERMPDNGEWWYRLGRLHADRAKLDKAEDALKRSVILGDAIEVPPPWLADGHRLLGDLFERDNKDDKALVHFERYLELAPEGAIDRSGVARWVRRKKRKDR